MGRRIVQAASFTCFVFGFGGWIYIAENAVFHPDTLARPLSHLLPFPREDTFGFVCFFVSFIALFTYMMVRDHDGDARRSVPQELSHDCSDHTRHSGVSPSRSPEP